MESGGLWTASREPDEVGLLTKFGQRPQEQRPIDHVSSYSKRLGRVGSYQLSTVSHITADSKSMT